MKTLSNVVFALCLSVLCSFSFAQLPDAQRSQGISYITGGVGEGESQAILAEAKQWPLLLELSQLENGRGVWIFGASIQVINSQKQAIFSAQADGPYMLINLSPGDYSILATYQGVEQKRSISLQKGAFQKISIFWK